MSRFFELFSRIIHEKPALFKLLKIKAKLGESRAETGLFLSAKDGAFKRRREPKKEDRQPF